MANEITTGAILIKDYAVLPKELRLEAEPGVAGWSLVKDFDGYRLDRESRKQDGTFSVWLAKLRRQYSVLTGKRCCAGQLGESWLSRGRNNSIP